MAFHIRPRIIVGGAWWSSGKGGAWCSSVKMAAATVRVVGSQLSRSLREVRLHLCQTSGASRGARDFIEHHYVSLKRSNPDFPFLIRECSGVQARLWARYDFGKEKSVVLDNMNADQVAQVLETMVQSKP